MTGLAVRIHHALYERVRKDERTREVTWNFLPSTPLLRVTQLCMIVHGYLDGDKYFSKSENCKGDA